MSYPKAKMFLIWPCSPSHTTQGDPLLSHPTFYHDTRKERRMTEEKPPPFSASAKVLLFSHIFHPWALPIRPCSACACMPTSQLERSRASLHPQPGLPSLLSPTISLINLSENLQRGIFLLAHTYSRRDPPWISEFGEIENKCLGSHLYPFLVTIHRQFKASEVPSFSLHLKPLI